MGVVPSSMSFPYKQRPACGEYLLSELKISNQVFFQRHIPLGYSQWVFLSLCHKCWMIKWNTDHQWSPPVWGSLWHRVRPSGHCLHFQESPGDKIKIMMEIWSKNGHRIVIRIIKYTKDCMLCSCLEQIWKCWNVRNTVDLRLLMTLQIRRWPLQIRRWQ